MTPPKQKPPEQPKLTPTERLYHALMASLTTPTRANEKVSVKLPSTGDLKGKYVLDELALIRRDDEDWPQFLGRIEQSVRDLDSALIRVNASVIERELAATLERHGGDK